MCDGVWVVVYSNYEPAEVDSIWATQELGQQRADELDKADSLPWNVEYWRVEGA